MKILITLLCLVSLNTHAIYLFAEDTLGSFIQVQESNNEYTFYECQGTVEDASCTQLTDYTFSRSELDDIAGVNYRNAAYTVAMDIASVFGGVFAGARIGLVVGAKRLRRAGYSLDGCANCGHGLVGLGLGASAGYAFNSVIDDMDPFIDLDMGKAFDAITLTANEGMLEDIEAREVNGQLVVTIEDLNFDQLREKLVDQFEDSKDEGWFF